MRFGTDGHAATAYLHGVKLEQGHIAFLSTNGLYPFLIEAYIGQTNPWGRHLMRPALTEITEEEARESIAKQKTALAEPGHSGAPHIVASSLPYFPLIPWLPAVFPSQRLDGQGIFEYETG